MAEQRDIANEVINVIREGLDVDLEDVTPEASFIDDLGADSLALFDLIKAFEEQFKIDIPDEDIEKIATVQQAIDYIKMHA